MSDLTAFWALLSRIEVGFVCVEGIMEFCCFGCGGGEGGSVPQASQERYVDGLTSVQMSQVQVSFLIGGGFGGVGTTGDGLGLVDASICARWPCRRLVDDSGHVPGSALI